jgi:hypothetical protein
VSAVGCGACWSALVNRAGSAPSDNNDPDSGHHDPDGRTADAACGHWQPHVALPDIHGYGGGQADTAAAVPTGRLPTGCVRQGLEPKACP